MFGLFDYTNIRKVFTISEEFCCLVKFMLQRPWAKNRRLLWLFTKYDCNFRASVDSLFILMLLESKYNNNGSRIPLNWLGKYSLNGS